ncbi:MAG: alanine racemase [Fusobacteriia bacterium 4572_132]|nr:MAG: alanine racemase [Fusobacteriia bacterium 4572_132]
MRIFAEIDLDKLKKNLKEIKRKTKGKKILGVIKANAYGHGAIEIAKELEKNNVELLGVASLEEAEELLNNGIKADILILGSTPLEDWKRATLLGMQVCLSNYEELEYIKKNKINANIHINIETGMGRIGFSAKDIKKIIKEIEENKIAKIKGIFTHYSSADTDIGYTKQQFDFFDELSENFEGIEYIHVANSSGILKLEDKYNMIRPGILLYGIVPFKGESEKKFHPILSLKSKIVNIQKITQKRFIGYNKSYIANSGETIVTVSAGYGDGLTRMLSNNGEVLIRGVKCKIVGNICMDHMMVKLHEKLQDIKVGEEVTIIGDELNAKKIAEETNTIPYEILTHLARRVQRNYIKNGKIINKTTLLGSENIG